MQTTGTVRARFEEALESFVDKVRRDPYILAALLFGSLAYDQVWEKSDIDLILIGKDERKPERGYSLVENGINLHVLLFSRSRFRGLIEGNLQSSFFHSSFSRSTLLFTHDESIREYYENVQRVGARDREMQFLRAAESVLYCLTKSEKWLTVRRDLDYSFLWLLYAVDRLAVIETLQHGEVTGREVIQQALQLNPTFFRAVYTDLIHGPKDAAALREALHACNGYLDARIDLLFRPVLDYLTAMGGVRSTSELDAYFRKQAQSDTLNIIYEWLADRGILRKVSAPLRLTEKSHSLVDKAAYYYDEGDR